VPVIIPERWISPITMALHVILLLISAGVIAGIIATMVGGGAVVLYPALIVSGRSYAFWRPLRRQRCWAPCRTTRNCRH
jgi:hypothetical protein